MSKISENLRLIRIVRDFPLRQVAQIIDRSPGTLLNWETGKASPDAETLLKLCRTYRISPNELLGWEPCKELDDFRTKQEEALKLLEELKAERAVLDERMKFINDMLSRGNK